MKNRLEPDLLDSQVDFIKQCLLEKFDDIRVTFGADGNDHILESMNQYADRFNKAIAAIFTEIRRALSPAKTLQNATPDNETKADCYSTALQGLENNHRKEIWTRVKESVTEIDCEIRDQLAINKLVTQEEKELILESWRLELDWIRSALTTGKL